EIVGGQGGVTAAELHLGEDLGPLGAQRRVPERSQHVVVARQHPAAERIRPIHGISSPHPGIDGVGVLEECGVGQRVRFSCIGEHGLVLLLRWTTKKNVSPTRLQVGPPLCHGDVARSGATRVSRKPWAATSRRYSASVLMSRTRNSPKACPLASGPTISTASSCARAGITAVEIAEDQAGLGAVPVVQNARSRRASALPGAILKKPPSAA